MSAGLRHVRRERSHPLGARTAESRRHPRLPEHKPVAWVLHVSTLTAQGEITRLCARLRRRRVRPPSTVFMKLDQLEAWMTDQRVAGRCGLQELAPSCADPKIPIPHSWESGTACLLNSHPEVSLCGLSYASDVKEAACVASLAAAIPNMSRSLLSALDIQ